MTKNKLAMRITALSLLVLGCNWAQAFEINGNKWPGAATEFYVSIPGISRSGFAWNAAFISAMDEWNIQTDFNFIIREQFSDPCGLNTTSSVAFSDNVCGTEFGDNTLAVTITEYISVPLGPAEITRTDIVVNNNTAMDIYDGPLFQANQNLAGVDFRRIALHELGHAIGLGHEANTAELPAIMAPIVGDLDRVQADDIEAVNTLYGGLSNCRVTRIDFGIISNSLVPGDCTVAQLMVGGGDTSFIDVYRFSVLQALTVQIAMISPGLDSVLLLADSQLNVLSSDSKSSGECDSQLSVNLTAGDYLLLANTYDVPPKPECTNQGDYTLELSYTSTQTQSLGTGVSLLGASSSATFSGGISNNAGLSYGNRFASSDSLTVSASIEVDPAHRGQPGFTVVAALAEGQTLILNSDGIFVPFNQQLLHAADKILTAVENIEILKDLVPAAVGIDSISVDFFVGYGLDSSPNELYFHDTPLNLSVYP